ncbi:hypothetical protein PMAYCL1PPCAC_08305, partial [Pristionchus mayeri]
GDHSEMQVFNTNEKKRETWATAVRSTQEGRRSLMGQLSAHKWSFLCSSHFSLMDFNHYPTARFVLKPDAVPYFNDSEFESGEVAGVPPSSNNMPNEREEDHVEIKEEPANDCADNTLKQQNLDMRSHLCGNSRPLNHCTPKVHSDLQSKAKVARRSKCVVCCRMETRTEMRTFALNHAKRITWINAVRSSPEERRSLWAEVNRTSSPMLCN